MSYTTTPRLGLYKPTIDADDNLWGDHLNANADVLDAAVGSVANVLHYGADPTGATDSTAAIRAAIATTKNVYLPAGTYRITDRLTLGSLTQSQAMQGDGLATTLLIGTSFNPAVTDGVVVLTGINLTDQRPMVRDVTFRFEQPADIVTTATATSAAATNTITVASVAGIVVGMAAYNVTHTGSIPSTVGGTSTLPCTVTNIAGNVLTLSQNVAAPGVSIGDSIHFASTRSMFKTIAAGGTATPGGTGVQYPWAIYCSGNVQTMLLDNIMIVGGWNGIYSRGSSFQFGRINVGVFNVGMDIDNSMNFPSIQDFRLWLWGYGPADPYGQARAALLNVYYDGGLIAATIGRCDGLGCVNFQTWVGQLNLTANWTWGSFLNLMLDGNSSNLNITPAGAGFVQIANCYATRGSRTIGHAVVMNPTSADFQVWIDNLSISSASILYRGLLQQNGRLSVTHGYMWHGLANGLAMVQLNGGTLRMADVQFDASAARVDTYISVTGASSVIQMSDCVFLAAPGAGAKGLTTTVDNPSHALDGVKWNGWAVTGTTAGLALAAGPTVRAGAGAATGTQPAGSLWLRTDGAAGARLYVSAGAGTWTPVAGV